MHILVVSQYFWPENFRINDLCSEFVKRGHKVTVLTAKPNYPSGKIFPDYLNNPNDFISFSGCEIFRVPIVTRGQGNSIKLILNYLSFAISAALFGALWFKKKSFDVIFVYEPSPITVGIPALFIKKLKGTPIVFWVLDLWPETLEAINVVKSKFTLNLVGKLVSFIYNRCDLVLGQSKAFYSGISRYCKDKSKIKYFPSWSEDMFLSNEIISSSSIDENNGFKILFAGNVGEAQDFPAILNAAELLKNQNVDIKFFIVGDGRAFNWVASEVKRRSLEDIVIMLGRHPLESMPSFYASADALLVTLKNNPVFSMTIPGKLQTYMAAGKPILTMLSGEGSRVVEEAKCGFIAESGEFEVFSNQAKKMSELKKQELLELGENAKRYAEQEFDRSKLISQLEAWFYNLSNSNLRSRR